MFYHAIYVECDHVHADSLNGNILVMIYCRCDICHFKFYMIQLYPGVVVVDIYNHVAKIDVYRDIKWLFCTETATRIHGYTIRLEFEECNQDGVKILVSSW